MKENEMKITSTNGTMVLDVIFTENSTDKQWCGSVEIEQEDIDTASGSCPWMARRDVLDRAAESVFGDGASFVESLIEGSRRHGQIVTNGVCETSTVRVDVDDIDAALWPDAA